MKYTLISSIGTGMYKEGYRETVYKFPDGREQKTNWFLQALVNKKYRDFAKIILVGTITSNWDSLVDIDDPDAEPLWDKLCECNNGDGITKELIEPLQKQLSKQYGIPVEIFVHTDKIDADTMTEVFNVYHQLLPSIPKDTDILFDITHGFRTMPILMYQNLQLVFSNNSERNIEFVYGEYIKDKEISYVRNMSDFWRLAQISDAINLFETKLDGYKLAELIKNDWPSGSKAIIRLTDIVQTNFALQFCEVTKQIRNSIEKLPAVNDAWVLEIEAILKEILKLEDKNSISRTLYNYSKYLFEKHLNTQAVITLQIAVESAIVEKFGNLETDLGNYDWISDSGRKHLQKICNKNDPVFNLEHFRNQIAHGGGKNGNDGYPSAANIPGIYKSGEKGLLNLYKILEL